MAKMIPAEIPNEVLEDRSRGGEIKTFRALEQLPWPYVVFFSVRFLDVSGNRRYDRECDFIIYHPDKGILCLEVKGGEIFRVGNRWFSINLNGVTNGLKKSPFDQAMENKHGLVRLFKNTPEMPYQLAQISHGVVFPDCKKNPDKNMGPDAPADIIICEEEFGEIEKTIERVYDFFNPNREPAGLKEHLQTLISLLAPRATLRRTPLGYFIKEDEDKFIVLTNEQLKVAGALDAYTQLIVTGGAGTGKTLFAIEQAKRAAARGQRTLFTCVNKMLADHVRMGVNETNLTVMHYHRLCYELGKASGTELKDPDGPDQASLGQSYFDYTLPEALEQAARKQPEVLFDCIVVDEGQDFKEQWWVTLQNLHKDFQAGSFYIFADDKQDLWLNSGATPFPFPQFPLFHNWRNTRTIQKSFEKYSGGVVLVNNGLEGRPVEFVPVKPEKLMEELEETLRRLVEKAELAPDMLAILTGESSKNSKLSGVEQLAGYRLSKELNRPGEILFTSIRKFKGLEKPVIILVEVDKIIEKQGTGGSTSNEPQPGQNIKMSDERTLDKDLYVGMSRARSHLVVLGRQENIVKLRG